MSQNDYVIANQTAPNFRADLNLALQALASNSSGATAPAITYANMLWYDTAANTLYMRSEADDAWITLGTLDQSLNTFTPAGIATQATAVWEAGTDTTESLVSAAKVAAAVVALAPSNAAAPFDVQIFTTSGSWVKPASALSTDTVTVYGIGGGGGGARDASSIYDAGGGNGGAGAPISGIPMSDLGSSVTIVIGAGGAGAVTANASTGGDTVWDVAGTDEISFRGGAGGKANDGIPSGSATVDRPSKFTSASLEPNPDGGKGYSGFGGTFGTDAVPALFGGGGGGGAASVSIAGASMSVYGGDGGYREPGKLNGGGGGGERDVAGHAGGDGIMVVYCFREGIIG